MRQTIDAAAFQQMVIHAAAAIRVKRGLLIHFRNQADILAIFDELPEQVLIRRKVFV